MTMGIEVLFLVTALTYTNAKSWVDLRQLSAEDVESKTLPPGVPPNYKCLARLHNCAQQLTTQPQIPVYDKTGLHVSKNNVDNICSVGAEFIPCIETTQRGMPWTCSGTTIAQSMRGLYDYGCVNNRTDMYNLVSCVNDVRVQLGVSNCMSSYAGQQMMLGMMEQRVSVSKVIRDEILCGLMYDIRRCSVAVPRDICSAHNAAAVLFDFVSTLSLSFSYADFDESSCQLNQR